MEPKMGKVIAAGLVLVLLVPAVLLGATNSLAAGSRPLIGGALYPDIQSVTPTQGKPGTKVTISGKDFGDTQGSSTVTVGTATAEVVSWSDTKIVIIVPEGASSGAIIVQTPGGINGREFAVFYPTWYLAEGSTAWGFSTAINIENPNPDEVTARITYLDTEYPLGKGVVKTHDVKLPASSQTVINANGDLSYPVDFSTRVDCLEGKTIAVDRTMSWSGGMGEARGAHNSIGVTLPARTWYLPEGSSDWGFECWTLIENPGAADAEVTLTYMVEGVGPKPIKHRAPAYSRATFKMEDDIGAADASIQVTSDVPVIPERSMYCYWTSPETGEKVRREGHDSIGTTTPATDFYLAEGSTAWGFTTYVLVQNPNKTKATVTITYNTTKGAVSTDPFTMAPQSRKTVRVNDVLPDKDLSTHVHADVPIIAERSMYWSPGEGQGQGMHDSIGTTGPHTVWYLPDGYTSSDDNGTETYTLVQNPSDYDEEIQVSYLARSGKGNVTFTDTVKANSRKTYAMGDKLSDAGASVLVECNLPKLAQYAARRLPGVIVERSIYYGGRWSGTDTIGCFDDLWLVN